MTTGTEGFLARRLFLGGIALVHALAFVSLGSQVPGLYGTHGIVPLAERMEFLGANLAGWERLRVPTLLWLGAGDAALAVLWFAGTLAAVSALVGLAPRAALATCWLCMLSFVSVGSPFLDFQWDALLLEAGTLAVLYAPGGLWPFGRSERAPAPLVRALIAFLLFKLLVLSGASKLLAGDASWRDGTALSFHYWTQPLPHRLSIAAAEAPARFQQASVLLMFVIELALPCLLLVPFACRRLRQVVAAGTCALMLCVFLTGNYGFFNLLTAVLAIPLLDDRAWSRILRRTPGALLPRGSPVRPRWRAGLLVLVAGSIGTLSLARMLEELELVEEPPRPVAALEDALAPLRSLNGYGLFRVMTKERPELAFEGSPDGVTWRPYRFRYKPDDVRRAPAFAGLHMPRLDWQLWFAALEARGPRRSPWVADFLERLLEGSPDVLALLDANPFPDGPPRFVRATVAPWRFATTEQRARGIYWEKGESFLILPVRESRRGLK